MVIGLTRLLSATLVYRVSAFSTSQLRASSSVLSAMPRRSSRVADVEIKVETTNVVQVTKSPRKKQSAAESSSAEAREVAPSSNTENAHPLLVAKPVSPGPVLVDLGKMVTGTLIQRPSAQVSFAFCDS
jgi:hypothetical protein